MKNSFLTYIFLYTTSAFGSSDQSIFDLFSLCPYNQAHLAVYPTYASKHHETLQELISDWNDRVIKNNNKTTMVEIIKEEIELLTRSVLADYRDWNPHTHNSVAWGENTFDLYFFNNNNKRSSPREPLTILNNYKTIQKLNETIQIFRPCSYVGPTASPGNALSIEYSTINALIPLIGELVITACQNTQVSISQKEAMIEALMNSKPYFFFPFNPSH